MEQIYDVAVLGGGPGGYTAALYCARAGLSTVVLEKLSPGGQMATTSNVENYPGFAEGVDGFDLAMQMKDGAERFGVETLFADATAVALEGGVKTITTSSGERRARTVILATGADPRPLGVPHEDELRGRGVAYCATCDGMLYRGKTVVVVGGGNSAAEDALFLSRVCKKVYLVHRGAVLTASKSYWTALQKAENVEFIWNSRVVELLYGSVVTGVVLEGVESGNRSELACDGVFIAVGRIPNTGLFHGVLEMDAAGYLIADETTRTALPGVFAVGDVRRSPCARSSQRRRTALWPPNMQKPIWPNRRAEENQNRRGHKKRPRLFWFWRKTYWPNRPARPPETPSPQLFTASEALCRASTAPFNLATASLNACTSIWLILPSSVLMARFTASISSFETCSATAARSTPSSAAEIRPMLFIVLPRHTTTAVSSTASSAAATRVQSSWPRSSSLVRRVSSRISFCSMVRLLSYAFAVMIARNRAAVHRFCAKQGRLSALWKTAGCATMKQQTGGMIP